MLEARFVAEANAKGVHVSEIVRVYLHHAPPVRTAKQLTGEKVDRALGEAAGRIPERVGPLSDDAVSLDSIPP
jgi:hypothetical protein